MIETTPLPGLMGFPSGLLLSFSPLLGVIFKGLILGKDKTGLPNRESAAAIGVRALQIYERGGRGKGAEVILHQCKERDTVIFPG